VNSLLNLAQQALTTIYSENGPVFALNKMPQQIRFLVLK
jgi:hypothetical protein